MSKNDIASTGTRNGWIRSESVLDNGRRRSGAHYLMTRLGELARPRGTHLPYAITRPIRKTPSRSRTKSRIPVICFMERRISSMVRWTHWPWSCVPTRQDPDLGATVSTFASRRTLYDIGFNTFQGANRETAGSWCFPGPSCVSPGILCAPSSKVVSARTARPTSARSGRQGPGHPTHTPWLMPDFWQFPTVSMGLARSRAIYQARFQ